MTSFALPFSILPAPYEIVWCRFPLAEALGEPGPYSRPALVRNVALTDGTGAEVEVAYGTTNLKLDSRMLDLTISKASEMDACGLYRATRFDLDRTVWLPWTTDWFEIRADYFSPTIGKLTPEAVKMIQIILSYKERNSR